MKMARLITLITLGAKRTFPCVLCGASTNIGFVDLAPAARPAWVLYPVCILDANQIQNGYTASDRPLHEVMSEHMKPSREPKV